MSWRWRPLLAEALANVAASTVRTAGIVLIAAFAFGTVAFLELRTADDLLGFVDDYRVSGGYVAIAVPAEGASINASACAALNGRDTVVAAGSLHDTVLTSFTSAPGVLFQRATVSGHVLRVWSPGVPVPPGDGSPGFAAGAALAAELGARPGSYLQPEQGEPARVLAVLDTGRRNPQAARWAFEAVPPDGPAEACWVEFHRDTFDAGIAALPALLVSDGEAPFIRPYRRADEFTRDPLAEFRARPQRLGWLAATGIVVATVWLITWFRRSDLGLYLALGTERTTLALMLAVESALLLGVAFVIGAAYAFAVDTALHHDPGASATILALRTSLSAALLALRTSLSAALLALALAPLGAVLLVRGTIADLLKDR